MSQNINTISSIKITQTVKH